MSIRDHEKALLFLYACGGNLESENQQVTVLAKLCEWTEDRARNALQQSEERGHSSRDND